MCSGFLHRLLRPEHPCVPQERSMFPPSSILNNGLMMLAVEQESFAASSGRTFLRRDHASSSSGVGRAPYGFQQPPIRAPDNPPPIGDVVESETHLVRSKRGDGGGRATTDGVLVEAGGSSLMQKASNGMWPWPEDEEDHTQINTTNTTNNNNNLSVAGIKMKKTRARRKKVREPRFCFKTMSEVDVLDDGYKWRKYGQKFVKNTQHLRSYYRCSKDNCRVKKRVERLAEDPRMVITTYEGRHAHSPSHPHHNSAPPSSQLNFFWSS